MAELTAAAPVVAARVVEMAAVAMEVVMEAVMAAVAMEAVMVGADSTQPGRSLPTGRSAGGACCARSRIQA